MLLTAFAQRAHADIDMTGRWLDSVVTVRCLEIAQVGTDLEIMECSGVFSWNGTIDPVTGAFTWNEGSDDYVTGTVAPDGRTYSGTYFHYHCTFVGCGYVPFAMFGSRCGAGTVDPNEDCDVGNGDGTYQSGACCTTECTFAAAGTSCDTDADPLTVEACDAIGTCLDVPPPSCDPCRVWDPGSQSCVSDVRTGCRGPIASSPRVSLKTVTPDASDAVSWTWSSGAATTPDDFGDPRAATALEVCIFAADGQGGTTPLLASVVPPGGQCGSRPCWSANGAATRYRYRRPGGDGLRLIRLDSGGDGDAKILLKGKGAGLGLPATFDGALPPVTVQLRRLDAPLCWEARFTTLRTSSPTRLRARDGQ
jgi:hypothetical protein